MGLLLLQVVGAGVVVMAAPACGCTKAVATPHSKRFA
jgi:hypothetical protein